MKRVVIVSELFYPEQTSTGYFLTEIAKAMTSFFDVHVFCAQPSYSERGVVAPSRENWKNISIVRPFSTHFSKDNLILRGINAVSFTVTTIFRLLFFLKKGDVIIVVTNPPTLSFLVSVIAKWRQTTAILLVHDVYPDVLSATNVLKKTHMVYKLLDNFMRISLRKYDHIIVLGRDVQDLLRRKSGKNLSGIPIIRNWADLSEIRPVPLSENQFVVEHGLSDKVVIQYSGNIGRTHDIASILEAATALRAEPILQFVFVGYGAKARMLAELSADDEMSNLKFLPRQPRAVLAAMLSSATAVVIPFEPSMTGLSVPSRMYNIMAAGVPIIAMADAHSELAQTVSEFGSGWLLEQGDSSGLIELCRYLTTEAGRVEAKRRGQFARIAAEEHFQFITVVDKYRSLIVD